MTWAFLLLVFVSNPDEQWFQCSSNECWFGSGGYVDKKSCEMVKSDLIAKVERAKLKVVSAPACEQKTAKAD